MTEETEIKKILEIVQDLHVSVQDLHESVAFIQENMATKGDLVEVRSEMATKEDLKGYATKEDLALLKSDVLEHIDGFAQQNQKFDHELIAAQAKFNRVEERVEVLELKAGIGA